MTMIAANTLDTNTLKFDTLKFANRLKVVDVPEQQAQAQAEALDEALSTTAQNLATKTDIREVRSDMREVESNLKSEIQDLRSEVRELEGNLKSEIRGIDAKLDGKVAVLDDKLDSVRWMLLLIAIVLIAPLIKSLFF
uniref:Uncharacterized protein n=1 Tax=Candidatus Kentrum sp. UNK TaxID=2126344 RepID=A0A451AT05_9GAMM|nr:MAG: Protein of unknown function (DUF1640) [Candidatus Kentron sp. UNK]VFK69178.1 MAG: Protein of unknown function (DUF1640) [Candidatus Kentron sp. UNK]